ncbi:MAG: hypothetical protein ACFFBP_11360 [Promethearchaeota archaeon]
MNKFLGFKKQQKQISNNLYMEDLKLVIKLPLIGENKDDMSIKAEEFDLTGYNIFIPYE